MAARCGWVVVVLVALLGGAVPVPAADASTARADDRAVPTTSSKAGARPTVSVVSPTSGPLTPTRVTIRGRHLAKAKAVYFGSVRGTGLAHVSDKALTVLTPAVPRGQTLKVRVKTRTGWARGKKDLRYSFVKAPGSGPGAGPGSGPGTGPGSGTTVTSLSTHQGPVTGGATVTVSGAGFAPGAQVLFGTLPAAGVTVLSSGQLSAVTPVSWPQTVAVTVTSAGQTSAPTAAASYQFVDPPVAAQGTLTPAAGTVTLDPEEVREVTRTSAGWTVAAAEWVATPPAGADVYLAPGHDVFPTGLAGVVTATSHDAQGRLVMDLERSATEDAFDDVEVAYAGDLTEVDSATGRGWRGSARSAVSFGSITASAFKCSGPQGSVSPSGKVTLELTDIKPHFEFDGGNLLRQPYVSLWVSYERTVAVQFQLEAAAECHLKTSWQNTHKKVLVGPYGISLSIGPAVSFKVSASGNVEFGQHSYHMTGFSTNPDGSIRRYRASSTDPAGVSASGTLQAEAFGGVEIQVGWLDRIGVGLSAGAGAKLALTASTSPPAVCGALTAFARATLYAYLDVWVKKWKLEAFEATVELAKLEKCFSLSDGSVTGSPTITTTALPQATVGRGYGADLVTADGRRGVWTLRSGQLPPGLALDADGTVGGTPSTAGSRSFTVRFTDVQGRTADNTVSVTVVSETPPEPADTFQTGYRGLMYRNHVSVLWPSPDLVRDLTLVSLTGLPPGLRVTSTGLLHGVPTATGHFELRMRVRVGGVTRSYRPSLDVQPVPAALAERLYGHVGVVHPAGSWGNVRQVRVSPDGGHLALKIGGWNEVLAVYDTAADQLVPLTTGTNRSGIGHGGWDTNLSWSPDGRYLAFTSTEPLLGPTANQPWYNVFVWDSRTGALRQLTDQADGEYDTPVWSPDGTRIAMNGRTRGGSTGAVRVWTAATGSSQDLPCPAPHSCRVVASTSAWSSEPWTPDGRSLVMQAYRYDYYDVEHLYAWSVSTGAVTDLGAGHGGRMTPDGNLVLVRPDYATALVSVPSGAVVREVLPASSTSNLDAGEMVMPSAVSEDGGYVTFWSCQATCGPTVVDLRTSAVVASYTSLNGERSRFVGWRGTSALWCGGDGPAAVSCIVLRTDGSTSGASFDSLPLDAAVPGAPTEWFTSFDDGTTTGLTTSTAR